jgi:hypothetical protein
MNNCAMAHMGSCYRHCYDSSNTPLALGGFVEDGSENWNKLTVPFVVNNLNSFQTNTAIHDISTKHGYQLDRPVVNQLFRVGLCTCL